MKKLKVILVNGSPHKSGCTYTSLSEVAKQLNLEGIETEIFHIGTKPVSGCIACGKCASMGRCVFDDVVNEFIEKAVQADGFVFGSPVYYASMNGTLSAFMDRAFYAGGSVEAFRLKPAAAIVNARRGGTTATFDEMNKYFTITEMPVISSNYWNQTHGTNISEVVLDKEGMQTMRILGRNMAYFLKLKEAGEKAGIRPPEREGKERTNFIR